MNSSSGIKRGLATTAVAALAVTGLPFLTTPASAITVNQTQADSVITLVQPASTSLSSRNDGQNTTQRLTAAAGDNFTSLTFQYREAGDANWQTIEANVTRNDDGAFATEWDVTSLGGRTVDLRVIGDDTVLGGTTTDTGANSAANYVIDNTANAVNITPGTDLGVFQVPGGPNAAQYFGSGADNVAAIRGTSAAGGSNDLTYLDANGNWSGSGTTTAGTSWTGQVDITGYQFAANNGTDEVLVKAANATTDDAESYTLYKQVITTATATASTTNPPGQDSSTVTVTIVDQRGNPVAGAHVAPNDSDVATANGTEFTDANGRVRFTQQANSSTFYYADATGQPGYNPGLGDVRTADITVGQFNPAPTSFTATSNDGPVFDIDENVVGDVQVTLRDQNENPFAPRADQRVRYYWVETPFDGGPATQQFPTRTATPTVNGSTGQYDIVFPTTQDDVNGTYTLFVSLTSDAQGNNAVAADDVLTVEAGEAAIRYADNPTRATAGSTAEVVGTLALPNGSGLPGRRVNATYDEGDETGRGRTRTATPTSCRPTEASVRAASTPPTVTGSSPSGSRTRSRPSSLRKSVASSTPAPSPPPTTMTTRTPVRPGPGSTSATTRLRRTRRWTSTPWTRASPARTPRAG